MKSCSSQSPIKWVSAEKRVGILFASIDVSVDEVQIGSGWRYFKEVGGGECIDRRHQRSHRLAGKVWSRNEPECARDSE